MARPAVPRSTASPPCYTSPVGSSMTEASSSPADPSPLADLSPPVGPPAGAPSSLARNPSFRLLVLAAAVSMLGTQVGLLAIPLVAVIALNASAAEVGLLG